MKIEVEIHVNAALEAALIDYLESQAAGMDGHDRSEVEHLADEARREETENWPDELKRELGLYLMFRAGFQAGAGYMATDWRGDA